MIIRINKSSYISFRSSLASAKSVCNSYVFLFKVFNFFSSLFIRFSKKNNNSLFVSFSVSSPIISKLHFAVEY